MLRRVWALLSLFLALPLFLAAETLPDQIPSIVGSVNTINGDPVGDARIEARDPLTGSVVASAYTRDNGGFRLMGVPPGAYEIRAVSRFLETHTVVLLKAAVPAAAAVVKLQFPNLTLPWRTAAESPTVSVHELKSPKKVKALLGDVRKELLRDDEASNRSAVKQVDTALELEPGNSEALTLRGLLKLRTNDNAGALDDLDRSAKADPFSALTFLTLGIAFNRMGKTEDAGRALERAITLDPRGWQTYYEMSKVWLKKGDNAHALRYVEQAQGLSPKDFPPTHLVRASALLGLGYRMQAVTELQEYVDREPPSESVSQARRLLQRLVSSGGNQGPEPGATEMTSSVNSR